ncbi:MBL fold metallo-hydrolase [Metabacillus sp. JX24]|uniref:MBL fold metallo-hydrolase n=1 Tax=Metabacillus sp. JX24 TaxID=3240759 RepID=UPI00350F91AD
MKFMQLSETCYYFESPVNIGYIKSGESGMLIDAGLDRQAAKKVISHLKKNALPLTHLFITHAHADHYGGASYIQEQLTVHTFASKEEAAILRNPVLKPIYLFHGAMPLPELRNKFLEGPPIVVDEEVTEGNFRFGDRSFECIALPGHSLMQMGVLSDGILYAADSYFGAEQLKKHKIPYIIDAEDTLHSLHRLLELDAAGAVPGHGTFEESFQDTVKVNISYHLNVLESLVKKLTPSGIPFDEVIQSMCEKYDVAAEKLSSWLLYRTAITAYLTKLMKEEKAELEIRDAKLFVRSKN